MNAFIGDDINLSLSLSRNNRALTGQTVTVSVIDQKDGAELLAEVACPETAEPGLYNFVWTVLNPTRPPIDPTDVLVIFSARSKAFNQDIAFIRKSGDGMAQLTATLSQASKLGATVKRANVTAAVKSNTTLTAALNKKTISAKLVEEETVKGSIK